MSPSKRKLGSDRGDTKFIILERLEVRELYLRRCKILAIIHQME